MSIVTKTGDAGMTSLMYGRRVGKSHPRVEAYGNVDELNSALGLARSTAQVPAVGQRLLTVQKDLVGIMGELATAVEDLERYLRDGFSRISEESTAKLDQWIAEIESAQVVGRGWVMPGGTTHSAALDLARAVCRRAERQVCALHEKGDLRNPDIIVYLNRLSDWLWLLARWVEPGEQPPGTLV